MEVDKIIISSASKKDLIDAWKISLHKDFYRKKGIERKWSWKKFRFMYSIAIYEK